MVPAEGLIVPTEELVRQQLATVDDPEIGKPITELGMVEEVAIDGGRVGVKVKLTIPGCPLKDTITREVTAAVSTLDDVTDVQVAFGSMTEDERSSLSSQLRAEKGSGNADMDIPFAEAGSKTRVIAIASGKGGVGKSSVTANLAVSLAQQGYEVGVLDADIWGYSIPRMMGAEGRPVAFEGMVMPLQAHGVKLISIGFFTDPDRSVIWRGPMLHRALQQFLADVYWGELDFLLMDLPPGTGDVAISLAQMLPNAEMLVVTTPQPAAQKVALRAGKATEETGMNVVGVVENMTGFTDPDGTVHEIFGSGGGALLAEELGTDLLARIPIDPRLRAGSDEGTPIVVSEPEAAVSVQVGKVAEELLARAPSTVVGRSLPLNV